MEKYIQKKFMETSKTNIFEDIRDFIKENYPEKILVDANDTKVIEGKVSYKYYEISEKDYISDEDLRKYYEPDVNKH